jgi:ABC-type amino acid transport substrate-binding protein
MKMKKWIFLVFAVLINCFIQSTFALSAKNIAPIDVTELQSGKRILVVGHMSDFPPFYLSDSANPKGLDPDIFKEVAKRAGFKKITYAAFKDFTALNQALRDGKIDVIVNDYWNIPDHSSQFLMTIPYYLRDGIAFVYSAKKHHFTSVNDLQNYKIGTFKGATDVENWLRTHPIAQASLKLFNSRKAMMQALEQNKIDAAFVYYTLYLYLFGKEASQDAFSTVLVQPIHSVYAVRRQDVALQKQLNKALKSIWSDGFLYKVKEQYLGSLGIDPARNH